MNLIKNIKQIFFGDDTRQGDWWNVLKKKKQVNELLEASYERPQLIYKHSHTCPICEAAQERIEAGRKAILSDADMHFVNVLHRRHVSNYIAQKLDIWHESPQAILIIGGDVRWHASHEEITVPAIQEALAEAADTMDEN